MKLKLIKENKETKKTTTVNGVDYTYGTEFVYSAPETGITLHMQAHHSSTGNSFGGDCYKNGEKIGEIKSICYRYVIDDDRAKRLMDKIEVVKMPDEDIVFCNSDSVFEVYGTYVYDKKRNRIEEQGVLCPLGELIDRGGKI